MYQSIYSDLEVGKYDIDTLSIKLKELIESGIEPDELSRIIVAAETEYDVCVDSRYLIDTLSICDYTCCWYQSRGCEKYEAYINAILVNIDFCKEFIEGLNSSRTSRVINYYLYSGRVTPHKAIEELFDEEDFMDECECSEEDIVDGTEVCLGCIRHNESFEYIYNIVKQFPIDVDDYEGLLKIIVVEAKKKFIRGCKEEV